MATHKGGKKSRKIGRDKKDCERYRARGIREKNKRRKLTRHVALYPNDKVAAVALRQFA